MTDIGKSELEPGWLRRQLTETVGGGDVDEWPGAVSDGLTLPCADCGSVVRFDYRVTDEFWRQHVSDDTRLNVVCLPCLDRRCGGAGLDTALQEVQWTGTGHTVVLAPTRRHCYAPAHAAPEAGGEDSVFKSADYWKGYDDGLRRGGYCPQAPSSGSAPAISEGREIGPDLGKVRRALEEIIAEDWKWSGGEKSPGRFCLVARAALLALTPTETDHDRT
jgi:hypothetical protein